MKQEGGSLADTHAGGLQILRHGSAGKPCLAVTTHAACAPPRAVG
jgi:hypothetical protein